jgi:hypothetical protein
MEPTSKKQTANESKERWRIHVKYWMQTYRKFLSKDVDRILVVSVLCIIQ